MASPVLPAEFDAVVPSATGSLCSKMVAALLQFPAKFAQWFSWFYDSDGNPSLEAIRSFRPVGTYVFSASSNAPTGCLECNGAAVSRTTYSELFAILGTTHGNGDGVSTFNLPSFVDRVARGHGTVAANATGGADTDTIVLTQGQLPSHQHYVGCEAGGFTHAVSDGFFRTGGGVDLTFVQNPSTKAGLTEMTGDGDDVVVDTIPSFVSVYVYIQA